LNRDLLPRGIWRALGALERRLFRVLFSYGLGRAAWKGCALLLAVFLLDRLLDPPAPARILLALAALALWAWHLRADLLQPMRRRPRARDLAAWWERADPALGDLLATAVDLADPAAPAARGSVDFGQEVLRDAERAAARLRAKRVVPSGRARRSLLAGGAAIGVTLALAASRPDEAWIFAQRLVGREVPWPSATRLLLQPLYVDGAAEPVPLELERPESWRASLARGSVVTVRVRAEGVVPDRVVALGAGGDPRPMLPSGGGEFLLRLPPLEDELQLRFRGGDDDDGRPSLRLVAGDAPSVREWLVRAVPPPYTGFPAEEGARNEWRVPRGTRLTLRFTGDRPVRDALAERLDGSRVEARRNPDGSFTLEIDADRSDQLAIALVGEDGFVRRRAGTLRWDALADRPPQARVRFPDVRWTTVHGAEVPLALHAEDEYGLAGVSLRDFAGAEVPLTPDGPRELHRVLRLRAPENASAEGLTEARVQAELIAHDAAAPLPQTARAQSAWIEVVLPEVFDLRQAERLVRVRVQTASLRDRLLAALESEPAWTSGFVRRARRDLEALVGEVEIELLMRLWSGLDAGTAPHAAATEASLLAERPAPGDRLEALHAAGLPRPLERAGLLAELAEALLLARRGPAAEMEAAALAATDPRPAARALIADLDRVLEILTVWEDYQSALNLLRDLIQRQREILLRTQEVSGR
jgi:hypothetical protein